MQHRGHAGATAGAYLDTDVKWRQLNVVRNQHVTKVLIRPLAPNRQVIVVGPRATFRQGQADILTVVARQFACAESHNAEAQLNRQACA